MGNEVAYGCGCEYRNFADDGTGRIVDDAPAIAQILQEGMSQCCSKFPAEHFLSRLGVHGPSYANSIVHSLPPSSRPLLPARALREGNDPSAVDCAIPNDLCTTMSITARGESFSSAPALTKSFSSAPALTKSFSSAPAVLLRSDRKVVLQ